MHNCTYALAVLPIDGILVVWAVGEYPAVQQNTTARPTTGVQTMPDLWHMTDGTRRMAAQAHAEANGHTVRELRPLATGLWMQYTDNTGDEYTLSADEANQWAQTAQAIPLEATSARQAREAGFGPPSYWRSLDEGAREHVARGVPDAMTRSLSDALRGNEGD